MNAAEHHIYTNLNAVAKNQRNYTIFFGLLIFAILMFLTGFHYLGNNMPNATLSLNDAT